MTRLETKLFRDLWRARWQFLSISLVAALGVALFQGIFVGHENERRSLEVSYGRLRFADLFFTLDGAPRSLARDISRIPGVRAVEARVVADIEMEQERGGRTRVIGRLIGMPVDREPAVNRLRILEGRPLANPPRREVLLEKTFARRHGYRPGDRLYSRVGRRRIAFTVAGIAASPEYIYPIQSRQFLLPTPETFGVMFAPQTEVEALLGLAGTINDLALAVEPRRAEVVGSLAYAKLKPYGPQRPILRAEQPSNQALQSDMEGNRPFTIVMPSLFLGSAALSVSLLLARWVQAQHNQVGFLRASGFSAASILEHYLEFGLVIGVAGGLIGVWGGHQLGMWMSRLHEFFFSMPYLVVDPHPRIGALAFCLSVTACLLGALGPALRAARITPAEAMRGQAPAQARFLARLRLPLSFSLPLRNMLRRPMRTLSTAVSVMAAVVLVTLSGSFRDSIAEIERVYLKEIQRYDLLVGFSSPRSQTVLAGIRQWRGVLRAEGTLEVPIKVRHGEREKETVAIGVPPDSRLRRLPGKDAKSIDPPPDGVLVSEELAQRLGVREAALLRLDYIQNRRHLQVSAAMRSGPIVRQPIGFPVYLRLEDLQRRFARPLGQPPDAITGALLQVDPAFRESIRQRLQQLDHVALVQAKSELEAQVKQLTAYTRTFVWIMFLFGAAMAFAGTYTAADSVLWERTRELATLRTFGFDMRRLVLLVSIENVTVAAIGAVCGLYPGYLTADFLLRASETEGFTMPTVIETNTYLLAVVGAIVLTLAAQWPGFHRLRGLNLAAEIREREE